MDTKTGKVRTLEANELPKAGEVPVNKPDPDCLKCFGDGSISKEKATRPERRRAFKRGLPLTAEYIPCPICNPA